MNDLHTKEQADSTLRWGGLAGILGSILMLVTFGFTAAFVGVDISPGESLARFPDIAAARAVENTLYLVILVLWVIHSLALYRALRRRSPAPALFGAVLSILGLVVLVAGALPHIATAPVSDLYQAPGGTLQEQATLVLLWHGIEAVFDALLVTGLVILPMGLIALGTAMLGAPDYGKTVGRTTVAFGAAGLAAATALLAGFSSMAPVGVFALIGFHLTLGWKTHRLARAPHPRMLTDA